MKIKVADRAIGDGEPCFIMAEAGVNHNGDVTLARKLIDAAKDAGADAVKFQTFTAEAVVTRDAEKAPYQKEVTGAHESQYDMLKGLELSHQNFQELFDYARGRRMIFLSSPFDEGGASLGVGQIDRIDEILAKCQKVAEFYNQRLVGVKGVKIPYVASNVKMSLFVYVIRLGEQRFSQKDRDEIIRKLKDSGVDCRDYFPPIHLEPFYVEMFGHKKRSLPITERISSLTIALPFHNNLTEGEVNYVCDTLQNIISKQNGLGIEK